MCIGCWDNGSSSRLNPMTVLGPFMQKVATINDKHSNDLKTIVLARFDSRLSGIGTPSAKIGRRLPLAREDVGVRRSRTTPPARSSTVRNLLLFSRSCSSCSHRGSRGSAPSSHSSRRSDSGRRRSGSRRTSNGSPSFPRRSDGVADLHASGRHSYVTEWLRNAASITEAECWRDTAASG